MTENETSTIRTCPDLNGDEIEATYKGVTVHRGRVTDLAPDHNLFWIMDEFRSGRRLLDLAELEVSRIQDFTGNPATNEAACKLLLAHLSAPQLRIANVLDAAGPEGGLSHSSQSYPGRRTRDMSAPDYSRFLSECIIHDPEEQPGLREDEMYGVYLSWCLMNQQQFVSDHAFWAAKSTRGYNRSHHGAGRQICPGLGMKGQAAVDYILSSQPSII